MILAAGLGTRLGELGHELPKPLLPVAGVPLVRYALTLLRGHGVRDVIVNTHHLGNRIVAELGSEVAYSHEQPDILGTGGGVRAAAPFFAGEPFFLVNGKIVVDVDLGAMAAHHRKTSALATLCVRADPDAARWGAIDVDESQGLVRNIRGAGGYMFTGIHIVEPRLAERIGPGFSDIIDAAYLPALARGEPIAAYVMDGYFWEHSTPARYMLGNLNLLRGQATLRHPPGVATGVDPSAQVAASARVAARTLVCPGAVIEDGAQVGPDVVIGKGARVRASAVLERAIVWDGAQAEGTLRDVIVTRARTMPVPAAPARP
jgi:NDP-sugar pyrophosphorylase family protein